MSNKELAIIQKSTFTILFWGLFFALFNFTFHTTVNGVTTFSLNLIPNIIGYILIAIGSEKLRSESDRFQTVFMLCFPMMLLSIPNITGSASNNMSGFHVNQPGPMGPLMFIINLISIVFSLILFYHLCLGMAEVSEKQLDTRLHHQSMLQWRLYLISNIAYVVILIFSAGSGGGMGGLGSLFVILLIIYSFVVGITFLRWMWACRARFGT